MKGEIMLLKSNNLYSVMALMVALCASGGAAAHNPMGSDKAGNLSVLVEQSNLVFSGRVVGVEYANAGSQENVEGVIPHTVVTYTVEKVLRGRIRSKTITMRFIGGSDGMGGFLDVSGVPKFEQGERDVLFVAGNGETACPLVQCEYGRFRIHENGVFNTHGAPVRAIIKNHSVSRGPAPRAFRTFSYPTPTFDGLMRNPEVKEQFSQMGMSLEEARKRYEEEGPKQITLVVDTPESNQKADTGGETQNPTRVRDRLRLKRPHRIQPKTPPTDGQLRESTAPIKQRASPEILRVDPRIAISTTPDDLPEGPMAIEEFVERVQAIIANSQRKPVDIQPLNINGPIRVVGPKLRQPTSADPGREATIKMDADDRAEVEMLKEQDFNPVLKRK
jgi:hypothetical protein